MCPLLLIPLSLLNFLLLLQLLWANCIQLKLPGLDERDVLLTKRQYVNITTVTSTTAVTISTITSNISTITMTTITTVPEGMKVKFSRNFEGGGGFLTQSQHTICMQVVKRTWQQYLSLLCKFETNRVCCRGCNQKKIFSS